MSDRPALPPSGGSAAPPASRIRFEVAPVPEPIGGFQVLVFVDGVEVTALGAGLGMDPYDVFVPRNRLVAAGEPRQVPIARCTCGTYGCGATDVLIVRHGDNVRWEWLEEKPLEVGVSFPAADYDAEVERLGADTAWETPERTAGRLVLAGLDRDLDRLRSHGLEPLWAATHHNDPGVFRVSFRIGDDYQVFVRFHWPDRTPQELAAVVAETLGRHPKRWPATWHAIRREITGPPSAAEGRWAREPW